MDNNLTEKGCIDQRTREFRSALYVNLRADRRYGMFFDDYFQQGQTGSCVANATAACYLFELRRYNSLQSIPGAIIVPSRLFIYYNARAAISETIVDRGCYIRHAFATLAEYGVCSEASWPYDQTQKNERPSDVCFRMALAHRISMCKRLDIHRNPKGPDPMLDLDLEVDGDTVLKSLQYSLTDGHPVVFGFTWRVGEPLWDNDGPNGMWRIREPAKIRHSKIPLPKAAHAVMAIGFDSTLEHVLCQNSMDVAKGLFWMPYAWITDYYATCDFWTMRVGMR